MKELTLKQLYGYSIMNWEMYLEKIEKAEEEKYCSFCRDVGRREEGDIGLNCEDCKLTPIICSFDANVGIYAEYVKTNLDEYESIIKLINALKLEYYKL
jgi:hypothetical protein